ncbi:MAG: hypothetical protein IJI01_10565 [Butyrivibrio sp.]|uniref:hypothetical protein n=1 Tax=Butyrivibrio sp. TaxID=28121 RepID=UPI0025C3E5D8|nr:hypothetical protein [Butyrivibrio sp.]MBQ6589109.1 hypothetical protein [Butyrivibrio sp.]
MKRESKGHRDEILNLRCFYLKLLRKIWIVPLAAIIGAALCFGIYTLATVTYGPARTYKAEARLYVSFAYDENKGTLVDHYNAYTWQHMLMPTDDILIPIIAELMANEVNVVEDGGPIANYGDQKSITKDELLSSINADTPSDVRLMLLSAENTDKDLADMILRASVKSLEKYGSTNKAFDSIKCLSIDEAKLVTYSDRSMAAGIFGAVAAAIIAILAMLLIYSIDDAIFIQEDAEKRYSVNVLGIQCKKADDFFKNELVAAFGKATEGATRVAVISVDSIEDDKVSEKDTETIKAIIAGSEAAENVSLVPMAVPGTVLDNYRKIGTCDGVIVCVPFGIRNGAITEHILTQLKKHECPVLGMVIVRADRTFMRGYYGIK